MASLTRQQFIDAYCARSKVDWDLLSKTHDVLPCTCDYDKCHGWAMVERGVAAQSHMELYAPRPELQP